MTGKEIDDLAGRVAALHPNEIEAFEQTLAGLRGERARAEEARVAGLRRMSDDEVVDFILMGAPLEVALQVLRDAGFVRHVTLEAAYREGYERGAYNHRGNSGADLPDEDDTDYAQSRGWDLAKLAKGS